MCRGGNRSRFGRAARAIAAALLAGWPARARPPLALLKQVAAVPEVTAAAEDPQAYHERASEN